MLSSYCRKMRLERCVSIETQTSLAQAFEHLQHYSITDQLTRQIVCSHPNPIALVHACAILQSAKILADTLELVALSNTPYEAARALVKLPCSRMID